MCPTGRPLPTGELARAVTEVVPDGWDLVDESEHDGDLFRFCIDDTCPRVVHQYLAPIEPGRFTAELGLRLSDARYAVVVDDDPGGCQLPANVSADSSFPLCKVMASGGDARLQVTALSPAVAERRFPADGDGTRYLIAIEATPG